MYKLEWMDGWTDGQMNWQTEEQIGGWMDGQMNGQTGRWTDEGMDGGRGEQMDWQLTKLREHIVIEG